MEENMRSRFELEKEAAEQGVPHRRTSASRVSASRVSASRVSASRAPAQRAAASQRSHSYTRRAVSRRPEMESPEFFSKELMVWQGMVSLILIVAVLAIRIIHTEPTDRLRGQLKDAISTQMTLEDAGRYFDLLKNSLASVGDSVQTIFGGEEVQTAEESLGNIEESQEIAEDKPVVDIVTNPETSNQVDVIPPPNLNDAVVDDEILQQLTVEPEEPEEKK